MNATDPLLYDRCIRRFQTPAEREADGRSKGYSGVLEADLYRSEAKLAALKKTSEVKDAPSASPSQPFVSYVRGKDGEVLPEDEDEVPTTKEEGLERWRFEMTLRFLKGEDPDFDYGGVDTNEEYDDVEREEEVEKWFDGETPEWERTPRESETGIQDF
ncbi:hypothetical protein LSUE1_G005488 [Lachnellula suecica]|uniref:CCD97-like C-terminal domain-containing protein n=1 Tax=Lachnellula suecica TaxID=602035 RepID=A0A8T9C2A1_9HELO|nr:hypothetical protein LSUE1_G005488 [Lachnellula suecica]